MSFEIHYYDVGTDHISLKADGSIEVWMNVPGAFPFVLLYSQARMLKKMIIAEYELERKG